MIRFFSYSLLTPLFIAAHGATAQEVKSISAYTPAISIAKPAADYPLEAARMGKEGWVRMSYVIDTEGNVIDPIILDFDGHRAFKRSALKAVKNWKFEPAMKNGQPTQSCDNGVEMHFYLEDNNGARGSFVDRYRKAVELIKDKNIEQATEIVNKLHEYDDMSHYELAYLWNVDAELARQIGDDARELKSLKYMLSSGHTHEHDNALFGDDYYAFVYQRMFFLYANKGEYANALAQSDRLASMTSQSKSYQAIEDTLNTIKSIIDSDDHIFVQQKISSSGYKSHKLTRDQFAFTDINGALETVEVRCDTHRETFTVAEGSIWKVPDKWGQCYVLVEGEEGAHYNLVEVGKI